MSASLKNTCFSIWRNKYERRISTGDFKPIFIRYIGVENSGDYCDILKTLNVRFGENKDKAIIFDGHIDMQGEFELINYINGELWNMDIYNMASQDIVLFDNIEVNSIFLKALDYVIPIAIQKENFFNDSVRNDFITKLIVWAYTYLRPIKFDDDINPKCVFYGGIHRHEIYFLMIMHLMSFDVLYLNPLKEEYWSDIDEAGLSELHKDMQMLDIETFEEKSNKGTVIDLTESITKQLKKDIERELYTDTGVYRDWQFRGGYTKSLFMDTVMEDLTVYWQEPAKIRQGFKVEGDVVTIPCLFQKVEGLYTDEVKYTELVRHCIGTQNTLFINDCRLSNDIPVSDNMYQLMFCQLSDGTFDIEEIKKLPMYKFDKYSDEIQDLILKKINETILDKRLYEFELSKDDILQLIVLVLHLNEDIVRMIDNFDFTSHIPKVVIFLNNEDKLSDNMLLLLGYLHKIGFDIVIFNPSGLFNTNKVIKSDRINVTRLQQMNYNIQYKNLKAPRKGFFDRLFK